MHWKREFWRADLKIVQALCDRFSRHSRHKIGWPEHLALVKFAIVAQLYSHLLRIISEVGRVWHDRVQPYQVWIRQR